MPHIILTLGYHFFKNLGGVLHHLRAEVPEQPFFYCGIVAIGCAYIAAEQEIINT